LDKVSELEPEIKWELNRNSKIKTECYDMADAYTATLGYMRKEGLWDMKNKIIVKN